MSLFSLMRNSRKSREPLIKSARAVSERFFGQSRCRKRRNTVCISHFRYRRVGGKDPLTAADDLFRGSPVRAQSVARRGHPGDEWTGLSSKTQKHCIEQPQDTHQFLPQTHGPMWASAPTSWNAWPFHRFACTAPHPLGLCPDVFSRGRLLFAFFVPHTLPTTRLAASIPPATQSHPKPSL